jgi:hypothetical protein
MSIVLYIFVVGAASSSRIISAPFSVSLRRYGETSSTSWGGLKRVHPASTRLLHWTSAKVAASWVVI